MPVLLSHHRNDEQETLRVSEYLKQNGVASYIELVDPELQSTDDTTAKLMDRILQCTHLMAVLSHYAEQSWWVPFMIGAGSGIDRRISSYQLSSSPLPEFLQKWPILKSQRDLDYFVRYYKQDTIVALSASHGDKKRISSANQFHKELKAAIEGSSDGGKGGKVVLKIRS
ncbi:MAG: hypothetical protein WBG92_03515 [Thiohalocapsa sp.]